MSKIKNGGLDQYGAEPFERQQFGRAGIEGVNNIEVFLCARYSEAQRFPLQINETSSPAAHLGKLVNELETN